MNKKEIDLSFGFKSESDIHEILEEYFGTLKNTKDIYGSHFEFDKVNDEYFIEIKTRRINHNQYDSLFFGKNKFVKGNELIEENPEVRIFYLWKCYDGIFGWEHDSSPYSIKMQGRCDRGRDEYNECIDIQQKYIKPLHELL
tara:strand:- start:12884 stop:13309 length:426 start_codon:yes stop_codon:yes gene_type:complete